jgi:hypothetical protein
MLINLTNHPSEKWTDEQKKQAKSLYGQIIDIAFPQIEPAWDSQNVQSLAAEYLVKIKEKLSKNPANERFAVHIQGEFTFVFALVTMLKEQKIKCIASTSKRVAEEKADGTKISFFKFIRFREYP